jgi:hypothetical protein
MSILLLILASGNQHPYLGTFVMLVFGFLLMLGAFQNYRKYRILADAPRALVRSMPMGLVHLRGKATGEPLISPLTGTRCFAYACNIQSYVKIRSGNRTRWEWQTVAGDDDIRHFYLDDGTGRVRVNPAQPEVMNLDLQRTFFCEIGKDGRFRSVQPVPGFAPPGEQAVWDYVHGAHSRKLLERVFEMQGERGKKAKAAMETALKLMGGAQKVGSALAPSLEISWSSKQGSVRVIEECFLADSDCVLLGTCTENPDPQGEEDRMLICQGENEKTFLLSTKTEIKLGRSMRNKSLIMFLLAVALIVGGAAIALHAGGML